MRLYKGKIEIIARDLITTLKNEGDIEVANDEEARLDVEAVLKEYLRLDRELVEEAKNRMEMRGLGYSHLGQVRNQLAKERGQPTNEDTLPYILDQILNILFHSNNVEEIYADDSHLRTRITPILRRHMEVDTDLDREVRSKIKHLEEGTASFDVEYSKVMSQIKKRMGLS
jgi:hypothetical protein